MSQNKQQSPHQNPADTGNLLGMAKTLIDIIKSNVDGILPVKVIEHNRKGRSVKVEHLIDVVLSDDQTIPRGTQSEVQVLVMGGGGFVIDFYLPKGSLGWIIAADRDLSLFRQSYKNARPNTMRKKSFNDSLFIPDVMTGYDIDAEDEQSMVIKSVDGLSKISLNPNGDIKIKGKDLALEFDNIGFKSSTLTHNGSNIGSTHTHSQSPDSAGNTQVDTDEPQ